MLHNTNDGTLELETDLPKNELLQILKQWEPWRHNIKFSNGVSTSQLRTMEPYSDRPISKLIKIGKHVPLELLRGGHALDIGCNGGYNSVYLAQQFGLKMTSVDVVPRHLEVARFLGEFLTEGSLELILEDVTFFVRKEQFDLALHLGTLYHLPNPILSIENTWKSLKAGGYLGLETTCFSGKDNRLCQWIKGINRDDRLCRWIKGVNDDDTNQWAFSKPVLEDILESQGFNDIQLLWETKLKQSWAKGLNLSRVIYVARK